MQPRSARSSAGRRRRRCSAHIAGQFDQLAAVVRALAVLREVSPRTLDVVAAMGELLSSRIIAAALTEAGVPAEWVDARRAIVTNGDHTTRRPRSDPRPTRRCARR